MDLILVFTTFYLFVYLNFNRSGAAGNLIWFFSSPPNRLHSFGNVKHSPGRICPLYQKLKTRPERAAAAASLPFPPPRFKFLSLISASAATLRLAQPHFRLSRFTSPPVDSLPLP
jgi:hypothetical protein